MTYLPFEHVTPNPGTVRPSAGRAGGPRRFTLHATRPAISHPARFAFPFPSECSPRLAFHSCLPVVLPHRLSRKLCHPRSASTFFCVPPSPIFHHDQGPSSSVGHWSRWCVFLSFSCHPGFTFLGHKLPRLFVYLCVCARARVFLFLDFFLWLWDVVFGA